MNPSTQLRMQPVTSAIFAQRQKDVNFIVSDWQRWRLQTTPRRQMNCPKVRGPSTRWPLAGAATAEPAVTDSVEDSSSQLCLENIRQTLIRQEDTIIFSVIERAQFARNAAVYQPDAIPVPEFAADGRRYSLLEYILRQTEQIQGRVRRYTSPDEHAFYPKSVPALVLPPITYPEVLAPCARDININGDVMAMYLEQLLPGVTSPGDDGNYGSAATFDVLCLQALSKRIHYGKFVAEAKFLAQPEAYSTLIRARDAEGLMAALTDRSVELKVVRRVRRKAAIYGQDLDSEPSASDGNGAEAPVPSQVQYKVSPDSIATLYDKWVMPMTKQVQVAYLLRRLDHHG